MIISNSAVAASSQSSYQKTSEQSMKVISGEAGNAGTQTVAVASRQESFDQIIFTESKSTSTIKPDTPENPKNPQTSKNAGVNSVQSTEKTPSSPQELKEMLIQRMMEALTGKRFKVKASNPFFPQGNTFSPQSIMSNIQSLGGRTVSGGLSIVRETAETESQSVSYSAAGSVTTADGKTINIDLSMSMSRSTASYMQTTVGLMPPTQNGSRAVDPLIVNYGGTAASLTDEKYDFDLDADGKKDSISFAGQGSGFLALDKNKDGKINDGSELFGPQSGNGFEELRKYDSDGNGWIDEADDIYNDLKIWSKDKNGNDVLYSLKELDIGAIYLNESKTDFGMYDSSGNLQGAMRSTSFFLKDSGGAGFVSHFDLLA